jgi:hypothetical protein
MGLLQWNNGYEASCFINFVALNQSFGTRCAQGICARCWVFEHTQVGDQMAAFKNADPSVTGTEWFQVRSLAYAAQHLAAQNVQGNQILETQSSIRTYLGMR